MRGEAGDGDHQAYSTSAQEPRIEHLCEVHAAEARGGRSRLGGSPLGGGSLFGDFVSRFFEESASGGAGRNSVVLEWRAEQVDITQRFSDSTDELLQRAARQAFDPEFGARPLRRTIQRRVDNELASMVLSASLNPGDKVVVGVEEGSLGFEVLEETALMGTTGEDVTGR